MTGHIHRRRVRQHKPQPAKLQGAHPAFIKAAARERAIGVNPKYLNRLPRAWAAARGIERVGWEAEAKAWGKAFAGPLTSW